MKSKKINLSYLKFLRLCETLELSDSKYKIEMTEAALLNEITDAYFNKSPLCVGDLMQMRHLGSNGTLHRRLKKLQLNGYIEYLEAEDARKKHIHPTKIAIQYYKNLSKNMSLALRES